MEEARRIIQKHIDGHLNKASKYSHEFNSVMGTESRIRFDCLIEQYTEAAIARALNAVLAEIGLHEVLTSDK